MSVEICVEDVTKSYGGVSDRTLALIHVSFEVMKGEIVCMLGPSGCGKTTMLNLMAGFEHPTQGEVRVGGEIVIKPGVDRGYVFQEHALFPWMRVRDNVGFGLIGGKRLSKAQKADIVRRLLEMVELYEFRDKYPHQLSGGMKQRVAIARALAPDPDVLLMDEPFAALDAQTRYIMQLELVKIHERTRKTIAFVTHSVDESLILADRILLFSGRPGRVLLDQDIDLVKPRDLSSTRVLQLKEKLLQLLRHVRPAVRAEVP